MGEKDTNFEKIRDKIDELITGQKYIISEFEKLKIAVNTLSDDLKTIKAQIQETSKPVKVPSFAASVSTPKTEPIAEPIRKIIPIPSSISTEPKIKRSDSLSNGPLKASIIHKKKNEEPITTIATTEKPIVVKPIIIEPTTSEPLIKEPLKPIPSKEKHILPPIVSEVFRMIEKRAKKGETAEALSKIMENGIDTITKSWKYHPVLFEVGTFARKLKRLPPKQPLTPDMLRLLLDELEGWKAKIK